MCKPKYKPLIVGIRAPYLITGKKLTISFFMAGLLLCCIVLLKEDRCQTTITMSLTDHTDHDVKRTANKNIVTTAIAVPRKTNPPSLLATNREYKKYASYSWMDSSKTYSYNFTELIRPRDLYGDVQYLIMVMSAPANVERRSSVRETWVKDLQAVREVNARVVFVLGRTENSSLQMNVQNEAKQFGDILQFDFHDAYRNNTIKFVTILGWVSQYRPVFLVRADDDAMINVAKLLRKLDQLQASSLKAFTAGYKLYARVVRSTQSKWYLSQEEYPDQTYPPYIAGLIIVMSGDVRARLYEVALQTRPFFVDDAFVTGCVAVKAGITRKHIEDVRVNEPVNTCDMHKLLAVHTTSPERMRQFSHTLRSTTRQCNSVNCSCEAIS